MGIVFRIGQAVIEHYPNEEDPIADFDEISVVVKKMTHPDAPILGDGDGSGKVGNNNKQGRSYIGFHKFEERTGLKDLFDVLFRDHSGIKKLREQDYQRIVQAIEAYKLKHPEATPHWEFTLEDADMALMEWFRWWMRYALDNCSIPAIYNY